MTKGMRTTTTLIYDQRNSNNHNKTIWYTTNNNHYTWSCRTQRPIRTSWYPIIFLFLNIRCGPNVALPMLCRVKSRWGCFCAFVLFLTKKLKRVSGLRMKWEGILMKWLISCSTLLYRCVSSIQTQAKTKDAWRSSTAMICFWRRPKVRKTTKTFFMAPPRPPTNTPFPRSSIPRSSKRSSSKIPPFRPSRISSTVKTASFSLTASLIPAKRTPYKVI